MAKLHLPSVAEATAIDIPLAGRFPALNRVAAYRAAKTGFLPVVQVSERRWKVPVAALRELLGLPIEDAALDIEDERPQLPALTGNAAGAVVGDE